MDNLDKAIMSLTPEQAEWAFRLSDDQFYLFLSRIATHPEYGQENFDGILF